MSNFHPPEVVGRDSETQFQVSENINCGKRVNTFEELEVFFSDQFTLYCQIPPLIFYLQYSLSY